MWKQFERCLKEKNVTLQQMSYETGIPVTQLSRYRNGVFKPSIKNLIRLSDYFNTSVDNLLRP